MRRLYAGKYSGVGIPQPASMEGEARESERLSSYFYFCLGLKFKEKHPGHVHLIIHDLYWRRVGSFIIQK